jgi:two-component system, chemotaxis family, protein-glutamate methylesterase/glutaminase
MTIAEIAPVASLAHDQSIRVMVVDDAIVVRGLLARWIEAEPGLQLVGLMRSGREALEGFGRADPDVVILDVDMPDMDGMTALPLLLKMKRDLIVIMASTLTLRNAEISLHALALGASDYVPKPQTTREVTTAISFRRELIDKIKALSTRYKLRPLPATRIGARPDEQTARWIPGPRLAPQHGTLKLRPLPPTPPRVLLVAASTGGPQAINRLFAGLNDVVDHAPVLIVQHMPPMFTAVFAEHLARAIGRPAAEAVHGEEIRAGRIYVAPGALHMRVARAGGVAVVGLDDGAPVNFCKPAVDPLFESAAEVWGSKTLAVVLTGMGSDGMRGAATLVESGGGVLAQDEDSSIVWGMPGAVANAGLCSAVLPLDQLAPKITRLFSGDRA